jgi:glycosyltransferase 2 family protein
MTAATEQNRNNHSVFKLTLRFLISAGFMIWLVLKIEWEKAFELMKEGSPLFFIAAFVAIQITVASSIWKWQLLVHSSLNTKERHNASLLKLGRYYYIGLFFNNFLPGSVGGDFIRILSLGKIVGIPTATASVAFERLTSGAALTAIVVFASLFMNSVRPFILPIYIVAGILVAVFGMLWVWVKRQESQTTNFPEVIANRNSLLIWINKGKQAIIKLGGVAGGYRSEGWLWWGVIVILSLLFQIGMAWINQLLFLGFGVDVPWIDLIVIISLISFITMLPVGLNGIGVREASYVLFFKELGVPDEIAISVSLLFFILVTVSSLAGGLFWLWERRRPIETIGQSVH